MDTVAYLCDGDARTGLNSLQLAVQAQVHAHQADISAQGTSPMILVKEQHIKEGLQRSHILYDKAGMSPVYSVYLWFMLNIINYINSNIEWFRNKTIL